MTHHNELTLRVTEAKYCVTTAYKDRDERIEYFLDYESAKRYYDSVKLEGKICGVEISTVTTNDEMGILYPNEPLETKYGW